MKKNKIKILIIIFIFVYFGTVIILSKRYTTKINSLQKENKELENKITSISQIPQLSLNDIFLLTQKNKTLSQSTQGKLYFSADKNLIAKDIWRVTIKLMGDSNTIADTADLKLETNGNIDVINIVNGDAFPLYPRKTIDKNTVLITGAASLGKSSITYGKPTMTFAVFQIKTKENNTQKSYLKLIPDGTHIYLSGEDITDQAKNFDQLEF